MEKSFTDLKNEKESIEEEKRKPIKYR